MTREPSARVFSCPTCGGDTHVGETRQNPSGLRRRRVCLDRSCSGRLTTQELVVRDGDVRRVINGEFVLVPADLWGCVTRVARAVMFDESTRTLYSIDTAAKKGKSSVADGVATNAPEPLP